MSSAKLTPFPVSVGNLAPCGLGPSPSFRSALPISDARQLQKWFPPLVVMPAVPAASPVQSHDFSEPWQLPLAALPTPPERNDSDAGFLPEIFLPSEALPVAPAPRETSEEPAKKEAETAPIQPSTPDSAAFQAAADYTDEDLAGALAPILEGAVRKAVFSLERGTVDVFLEPMLRATVRRALAEYTPGSKPFQQPGFIDRSIWRLQALFSSRTYEDVLFDKTNRFQVEEVYLLDAETLALISFASCDPARHSAVKRIESSAQRIALQLRTENGELRRSFERPGGKNVICEKGKFVLLVAIVRGQPNELIIADLEFSLHRIEEHFQERFQQAGSALMHALQPFLEDCLLIQAPASAA